MTTAIAYAVVLVRKRKTGNIRRKEMNSVSILMARGGSKRKPQQNIKDFRHDRIPDAGKAAA